MRTAPPDQFEGFCVGFEVALYRAPSPDDDFDNYLELAIDYGLGWCDRSDLLTLGDFLRETLSEPNAATELTTFWEDTRPRTVFFSGPDASPDRPAIVQVFTRVLMSIEKKLG